jgi:hypothetical protein
LVIPRRLQLYYEHARTRPSSGSRPSKDFTNEVGVTPLGNARLAKRLKESIPKSGGTETQTFAILDLFFYFIFGKTGAREAPGDSAFETTLDSGEKRNLGGGDSPTFREADPELALAAQDGVVVEARSNSTVMWAERWCSDMMFARSQR